MDRVGVFVDAGYLFAAGSQLVFGESRQRSKVRLLNDVAVQRLVALAEKLSGMSLLRVYWYDGTSSGPTPQHTALANLAGVKVRLGIVNSAGQQKGVDSLIVTDLINLARNRAMTDSVLLTGDEDIRVGVQQAQEYGVRVHLVGIAPASRNQSSLLIQEADTTTELSVEFLREFLQPSLDSDSSHRWEHPSEPSTGELDAEAVATSVLLGLDSMARKAVISQHSAGRGFVDPSVDRLLLLRGRELAGRELGHSEKSQIRSAFLDHCRRATD